MLKAGECNPTKSEERENEKADYDLRAVDRPGAAGARLPARRWDKADPTARGYDGADAAAVAGRVLAVHRRGRGARRDRPNPPWAPGDLAGPNAASRLRVGDHHDQCDGADGSGWRRRVGTDPAGGGAPLGIRSLRSRAAGSAPRGFRGP